MGDHYLLNGAKMWITNGTIADVAVVWAKLDGVIRGFIVEKDDEGFCAPEMKGKHSLKGIRHQRTRLPRLQNSKGPNASGRQGTPWPLLLLEQRSIWNFMGRS